MLQLIDQLRDLVDAGALAIEPLARRLIDGAKIASARGKIGIGNDAGHEGEILRFPMGRFGGRRGKGL